MRWLSLACLLFIIVSCSNNTKVPDDIIPPRKMEKVFWDMVQADRFAANFLIKEKDTAKRKKETFGLYEKVFSLHDITREEFNKSYIFYMSRPDLSKTMFDSIAVQAERRKAEVYTLQMKRDSVENKKRKDSSVLKASKDSLALLKTDSLKRAGKEALNALRKKAASPLGKDSLRLLRKRPLKLLRKDTARPSIKDSLK